MKTRTCTKCGGNFPLTDEFFYKHKSTKTGFHTHCIECIKEKQRSLRKDPEKREIARIRASKHWHDKSKEERSIICNERRLSQRFKRTPEWYEETLASQDGHCALCSTEPKEKRLNVDHDHKCCPCITTRYTCGKCVRGLLCDVCNQKLGFLEMFLSDFPKGERQEICEVDFRNMVAKDSWTHKALQYLRRYQ